MKSNNTNHNNIIFGARIPYRKLPNNGRIREFTTQAYSDNIFLKIPQHSTRTDFEKVFIEEIGSVPYGAYIRYLQWKWQGKSYGVKLEKYQQERSNLYQRINEWTKIESLYFKIALQDKKRGITSDINATDEDRLARVRAQKYLKQIESLWQIELILDSQTEGLKRNDVFLSQELSNRKLQERTRKLNEKVKKAQTIYRTCVSKCINLTKTASESEKARILQDCDNLVKSFFELTQTKISQPFVLKLASASSPHTVVHSINKSGWAQNAEAIENIRTKIHQWETYRDGLDPVKYGWVREECQKSIDELIEQLDKLL